MDASNAEREHAAEVPGRHRQLPHRPVLHRRDRADPQGEHRAATQARQQVHAGAEGPEPQRQPAGRGRIRQPGRLRAGDDRRLQGCRHLPEARYGRSRSARTTSCTGSTTSPRSASKRSYLDDANVPADVPSAAELKSYARARHPHRRASDVGSCSRSRTARSCPRSTPRTPRRPGLGIITWTLERSGRIVEEVLPTKGTAAPSYYYQTTLDALTQRRRYHDHARRAGQAGRHPRHLLRLGGQRQLLRELHGPQVSVQATRARGLKALL